MQDILRSLYLFSAAASLAMLVMGIYARSAPKSLYFTLLTLAIFIINLGFVFEITAASLQTAIIATQVQYFGGPFIAPFVLLFVCEYCGIKLKRAYAFLLLIIPVAAWLMVLTWPLNGIFYQSVEFSSDSLLPHLVVHGSVYYYVFQIYNSVLPLVSDSILLYYYFHRDRLFKKQSIMIILATVLPVLSIVFILVLGIVGIDFDPTPIFLGITCLLLGYSILKLGLYRVAPIAREQTVETMKDGFVIMDMHGNFLDANIAAKRILPQLKSISPGMKVSEIEEIAWLSESVAKRNNEFNISQPDNVQKHFRLSETEVTYSNKVIGRCIMIFDITETKQLLNEATLLAERDPLTGLINRRTFFFNGEELFNKLAGSRGTACMLMMDIDFFKNVNDVHGHIKGDEVLRSVAEVLSMRFRITDLLARYGGEEFCGFLPNISEHTALNIAEQFREHIQELSFSAADSVFHVTISTGLALYDSIRHSSLESLLSDADDALYAAKNGGRNAIFIAKTIPDTEGMPGGGQISITRAIKQ